MLNAVIICYNFDGMVRVNNLHCFHFINRYGVLHDNFSTNSLSRMEINNHYSEECPIPSKQRRQHDEIHFKLVE